MTPTQGDPSSPANYRGRRAAYPPFEQGGTTEISTPIVPDDSVPGDSVPDDSVPDDSDRNGTHPNTAAPASWQDPLTSEPLGAASPGESPEWWTTRSQRDEPTSDGGFEDPLGLSPTWSKRSDRAEVADPDTGSSSVDHRTSFDRRAGDAGASDIVTDWASDSAADRADDWAGAGANAATGSEPAAPSIPAGADAWEVATGRTAADPDLPSQSTDIPADERTISPVWERDFTQTTTMWGRYDSEPTVGAPSPAVPGAADVDLSEAGLADPAVTGVTGARDTDPALRPNPLGHDALGSDAAGTVPAAPSDVPARFDLDEPLTGTAPIQAYSGPQPPWMRYGASDDPSMTESMVTSEPAGSNDALAPAPGTATSGRAPKARESAEPAIPPPAEPRSPRPGNRPLWRDEAEPELPQPSTAPRSAGAGRRQSAAVEDTADQRRPSGLPGMAAIVLGLGITVGAGAFDLFWTGELGLLFSVCFGLVAFGVAATIRRSDIFTAAVLPPLELLLTLVALGLIAPERLNPAAANQLEAILSALAASWITLVAAVLITFGVLVIRWALGPRPPE